MMPPKIITNLVINARGKDAGVADFEAAMAKAKAAAAEAGNETASSFEAAQRRWSEIKNGSDKT